ncbi:hypothetical protein LINPERPRIM_LOCUS5574 [Linum perenne]
MRNNSLQREITLPKLPARSIFTSPRSDSQSTQRLDPFNHVKQPFTPAAHSLPQFLLLADMNLKVQSNPRNCESTGSSKLGVGDDERSRRRSISIAGECRRRRWLAKTRPGKKDGRGKPKQRVQTGQPNHSKPSQLHLAMLYEVAC